MILKSYKKDINNNCPWTVEFTPVSCLKYSNLENPNFIFHHSRLLSARVIHSCWSDTPRACKCNSIVRGSIGRQCVSEPTSFTGRLLLYWVNTLSPRQNDRQFADDIFKCIFVNEKVCIFIQMSMKYVPNGPVNNKLLVQIMAWRRLGHNSMVSCQKGPTRHAYAWQIGPFWQDTLHLWPDGLITCNEPIVSSFEKSTNSYTEIVYDMHLEHRRNISGPFY